MTPQPLALHDVSVSLGGRPIVRQVELAVHAGEFVTLLGSNGSGKSTLVRACVRLLAPTTGSITLFDTPIERFRDWRRIGYVPQRAGAASGVPSTVREVVMTGRLTHRRYLGWPTRTDRRAVTEALELVELDDRASDPVAQLSGGQQQRVMIARALAGRPELLILDEPTAGVDHHSQHVLAAALHRMAQNDVAVVMVAHELGPFKEIVDRAVVLRDGRISYDGDVARAGFWAGDQHHAHPEEPTTETPIPPEGAWP